MDAADGRPDDDVPVGQVRVVEEDGVLVGVGDTWIDDADVIRLRDAGRR